MLFQVASCIGVRGQSPFANCRVFVEGSSLLEAPFDVRLNLSGILIRSTDPVSLSYSSRLSVGDFSSGLGQSVSSFQRALLMRSTVAGSASSTHLLRCQCCSVEPATFASDPVLPQAGNRRIRSASRDRFYFISINFHTLIRASRHTLDACHWATTCSDTRSQGSLYTDAQMLIFCKAHRSIASNPL
ncbi:hypothetical protein BCR37DRAFT_176122 [Protomyces lactucae-debilis]|uniref:Uncharacterized protein n=1 Tax=Protomyces lactucae-debilis TaxID=2754530 RepID=A0A1Y2EV93_PROLT|nr:uncharacterized protein BCR37DRAFT_176122 [Protomyces lactucae-debilis]ORY75490.1 hypothetical protein BCR37DRAFT_176122 [Protomyces lactucae-debilis]